MTRLLMFLEWSLVVLLTLLTSGLVRTVTNLSLPLSLLVAISIVPASFFFYRRFCPNDGFKKRNGTAITCLLLVAVLTSILFVRNQGGIATIGNADAGLHVQFYNAFIADDPHAYNGFVTMYGLVYWLQRFFSLNIYYAFAAGEYIGFALLVSIFSFTLNSYGISVHSVAMFAIVGVFLIVPLFGEFMIQGALVHVFCASIIPLIALGFSYNENVIMRVIVLLGGITLLRYSYGLNTADLMVASAVLIFFEGFKKQKPSFRLPLFFIAAGLLGAAGLAWYRLSGIIALGGAATPISVQRIWIAIFFSISSVLLLFKKNMDLIRPHEKRLFMFSSLIGAVMVFVQLVETVANVPILYYGYKYTVYPSVLCILTSALIIVLCISSYRAHTGSIISFSKIGLTSILSLLFFAWGYQPYFKDIYGTPLALTVDMKEWRAIERTLAQHNRQFGGLMSASWPRFSFVNAAFGQRNDIRAYKNSKLIDKAGYCIFWESTRHAWEWIIKNTKMLKGKGVDNLVTAIATAKQQEGLVPTVLDEGISYICF